jgi:hypothetical protein
VEAQVNCDDGSTMHETELGLCIGHGRPEKDGIADDSYATINSWTDSFPALEALPILSDRGDAVIDASHGSHGAANNQHIKEQSIINAPQEQQHRQPEESSGAMVVSRPNAPVKQGDAKLVGKTTRADTKDAVSTLNDLDDLYADDPEDPDDVDMTASYTTVFSHMLARFHELSQRLNAYAIPGLRIMVMLVRFCLFVHYLDFSFDLAAA